MLTLTTTILLLLLATAAAAEKSLRIVGGTPTEEQRYPWMVALVDSSGLLICGGALVAPRWVLTSARCVVNTDALRMRALPWAALGAWNFSDPPASQVVVQAEKAVVHPFFHAARFSNDVALLRLPAAAAAPFAAAAVRLAGADDGLLYSDGAEARVIGWGRTAESASAPVSSTLLEARVRMFSRSFCEQALSTAKPLFRAVCAGTTFGGADVCYGDIGGPLFVPGASAASKNDTLLGVASWFVGCGRPNVPTVYTDVREYRQWISGVVDSADAGASFCQSPCCVSPDTVNADGSSCVLSVGDADCRWARCYGTCLLGDLGNDSCDDACDTVSCAWDQGDCGRNATDFEDPSFEEDPATGPWETYDEAQSTPLQTVSRCNSTSLPAAIRNKCHPAHGKRFAYMSGYPLLVSTDSYISQRPEFPASGPLALGMYLQMYCSKEAESDWLEIRIDATLLMRFDSHNCSLYNQSSSWAWVMANASAFADGNGHEIVLSAHVAPASVPSAFFVDVVRLIGQTQTSADPEDMTGPCGDQTFPVVHSTADPLVCHWLPFTCCSTESQAAGVKALIESDANSGCHTLPSCLEIISGLHCVGCMFHNESLWNADGKLKICKSYAEVMFYLCGTSELLVEGKCASVSSAYPTAELFAARYGIIDASTSACFFVDPTEIVASPGPSDDAPGLSIGAIVAIAIASFVFVAAVVAAIIIVARVLHFKSKEPDDLAFAEREFRAGRRGFLSSSPATKKTKKAVAQQQQKKGKEEPTRRTEEGVPLEALPRQTPGDEIDM